MTQRKKPSVLLVEDHPELLRAMRECVESLGFEPILAADGRTAMNRLAKECPALVCLDVVLPESSGYELCGFIRSTPHLSRVPVLMMSGRSMPAERAFAEEAGADDFLPKPFSRELFARRVQLLLEAALRDPEGRRLLREETRGPSPLVWESTDGALVAVEGKARSLKVSVVVPSCEGAVRVKRLLGLLGKQTMPPEEFEVIVVDDGSPSALEQSVDPGGYPFSLTLLRQKNAGAAAARHQGALQAQSKVLLFLDDDTVVGEGFLAAHAAHHAADAPQVVLGKMRGEVFDRGLMERWHQIHLDGKHLFSGNVSLRRQDYLRSGGFDPSLRRGHDGELGLRLEKLGLRFVFSEQACSLHGIDTRPLGWWRDRAMLYGRMGRRISRKHPELAQASPWVWLGRLPPAARPFIHLALRSPEVAAVVGTWVLRMAQTLDALRLCKVAYKAVTLAYTIDYVRGLRAEIGERAAALQEARALTSSKLPPGGPTKASR